MNEKDFKAQVRLRADPSKALEVDIQATDKEEAIHKLSDKGYMVINIAERGAPGQASSGVSSIFKMSLKSPGKAKDAFEKKNATKIKMPWEKVSNRELIFFAVQLGTLLKAGVPLMRAMDVVNRGLINPIFKASLTSLKDKIMQGTSFHQALRLEGNVFPRIWVNLVEVGESTGKLPECLDEIANYMGSAARIKAKVTTAFFYPTILTVAVTAALGFLLVFIVPKFQAIFSAQKLELPTLTKIVVATSDALRFHAPTVLTVLGILIAGIFYAARLPAIKLKIDQMLLKMPIFGELTMQVAAVRFCRSLKTLLHSGVQLLKSLEISGRLLNNSYLENSLKDAATAVSGGASLGRQLEQRQLFPIFMTQFLSIGEESGQMELFLDILANYYEEQVDTFLARLTSLLEPFLLIFMGGVIGIVVISMFMPIIMLSTGSGMSAM